MYFIDSGTTGGDGIGAAIAANSTTDACNIM
jgi:hypothetical protein